MDSIDTKVPDSIEKVKIQVNSRPKPVLSPYHLVRQLRAYEELLAHSSGSLPYWQETQLNSITEALAVLRGKYQITQDEIDTIAELSNWMNYKFKEL